MAKKKRKSNASEDGASAQQPVVVRFPYAPSFYAAAAARSPAIPVPPQVKTNTVKKVVIPGVVAAAVEARTPARAPPPKTSSSSSSSSASVAAKSNRATPKVAHASKPKGGGDKNSLSRDDNHMTVIRSPVDNHTLLAIFRSRSAAVLPSHFISGIATLTLVCGGAVVNSFSLPRCRGIPVNFPVWAPAGLLTSDSRTQLTDCRSFVAKVKSGLKKTGLAHKFPESQCHLATVLRDWCGTKSAVHSAIVVEGTPRHELEWLSAIEDFSKYGAEYCTKRESSSSSQSHRVCVGFESGLLANASALNKCKIDVPTLPISWRDAIDRFELDAAAGNPVGIIAGAKGVGKSTFLRAAINRLVSKKGGAVCVIDCDVGQSEYSVPGLMSLNVISSPVLAPSHMNLLEADTSVFFGDITTKHDPALFAQGIAKLYQRYLDLKSAGRPVPPPSEKENDTRRISSSNPFGIFVDDGDDDDDDDDEDRRDRAVEEGGREWKGGDSEACDTEPYYLPLLINTDGNVRMMGAEILRLVVDTCSPSHIFQLVTDKDRVLPAFDPAPPSCQYMYGLEPGRLVPWSVAAIDLRNLRLVSYFLRHSVSIQSRIQSLLYSRKVKLSTVVTEGGGHGDDAAQYKSSASPAGLVEAGYASNEDDDNADDGDNASDAEEESKDAYISIKNGTLVDPSGQIALAILHESPYALASHRVTITALQNMNIPDQLLLPAINASVVGLSIGGASDDVTAKVMKVISKHNGSSIGYKAMDSSSSTAWPPACHMLGIVRAIDMTEGEILIIAPTSHDAMSRITEAENITFIKGNLTLPLLFLQAPGLPSCPYLSGEASGEGSSAPKARNVLKRKSQQLRK
jgi:mRNA cleavage and polyadenylation factor CLP1 P-loop